MLVLLGAGLSGGCEDGDPSRDGQSFAGPTQPGSNPTQIIVNVATQGLDEDLSLSGYTVQLGGDARGVPINGQVRFQDLQPGTYTLTVTDLPPNCSVTRIVQPSGSAVTGQASVQAALPVGTTLSYRFEVGCAPNVGRIVVFNDTKGDPGVSTYSVIVAGPDQNVALGTPPNYNLYVDDIRVGPVTVQLGGIPAHCLVAGDNPVQVDLAFGQSITVPFYLDCSGTMGSLSVTTRTFGANPDPDGYLVNVADQTIGFSNSMTYDFGFLAVGDYVVTLYDVAQNCTVSPASPHTVTILPGVPTDLVFDVTCGAVGSVSVDLATGGVSLDPDGYTLVVDGRSQAVPINPLSPIVVDALPAGSDVEVRLDGIASDCGVAEANPQSVTVVQDVVTPAPGFTVTCLAPTPPVVFESDRDGDFDIYAMNPDGSGVVALTTNGAMDIDPSWSWDNQRIVFVSDRGGQSDVWVMNADGSNPIQITDDAAVNEDPEFSPDGSKIVFEREDPDDGTLEIFMADADGSNPVQLTDAFGISEAPHFHPDGTEILFKSDRQGVFDIYLMDVNGSNVRQLTFTPWDDFDASWSPDGSTIVFSSQRAFPTREDLWIMNRDGGFQTRILFNSVWDWHPVYSTDGTRIIFTSDRETDDEYELYIMNADGSGVTQLTFNSATDDDAEFKKPGS